MLDSPELQAVLLRLGELAVRNTAAGIAARIASFRGRKDTDAVINELCELVNDLVSEKSELISVGKALESEFTAQHISDSDIQYINEKVIPVVESLAEDDADALAHLETFKQLISIEALTVLQLVGFNYKQAIGQPLTELVAHLIGSQVKEGNPAEVQLANIELQTAAINLAQSEEAYERFSQLWGRRS